MKPYIERTAFGSITIDGETYDHDVLIRLKGTVEKRKKKLSKQVFGTSHIVSIGEAEQVFETGARRLIIGTGQTGMVTLSDEAATYFREQGCRVELLPTPDAILAWNETEDGVIGLFHITC